MKSGKDVFVNRAAFAVMLAAGMGMCGGEATAASSKVFATLHDTGSPQFISYDADGQCNFSATLFGWSSGQLCSPDCANDDFPQNRTIQAFEVPPAPGDQTVWRIMQLGVEGYTPGAHENDTLDFEIFARADLDTPPGPADSVASGSVPFPPPVNNSQGIAVLHIMSVDVSLPPGSYWLSVWGSTDDPDVPSAFAWFTNAPNGINVLDGGGDPYLWRAAAYPNPGFELYTVDECTLAAFGGSDPDDLYNASFYIMGGPPCLWDVNGSGSVDVGDFLALLAAWGDAPGHPADFDGDGVVGVTDFLEILSHWGPCS